MTNEDKPLDLDEQPFAADLDAPLGAADQADADDAAEADPWGPDPDPTPAEPGGRPVADEWVRPAGQSSSLLILMGVVILVMVGVVVFLAIKPDKTDDKADAPPIPAAGGEIPAGDPGAAPPDTTPDPGTDPDLDDPATITDDFERPGPELGTLADGTAWNNQIGTVEIDKGTARAAEVDEGSPLQLVTVDVGSADVTAEVRLPSPADYSGLAIRVATPDRFIGLFATNGYGTYTLARVENGAVTEENIIGNTDLTGVKVGDVIGIRATGSKVEVLTNGTVRNSFDDPKLQIDGTGVGFFAFVDDGGAETVDARQFANWDDFKVLAR